MPKTKTNSAASKRVRVTGSGKLMHAGSANAPTILSTSPLASVVR